MAQNRKRNRFNMKETRRWRYNMTETSRTKMRKRNDNQDKAVESQGEFELRANLLC